MKKENICRIFSEMPILTTDRFILRKLSLDDTDDMYEYAKDAGVTRFLTWSPHKDKAFTLEYLTYLQTRYKAGEFYDWAIVCKDSGKMIGTCGFTRLDLKNDFAEIGYVINPEYHGQGIATEVVGRVIKYGFENLMLNRIECRFIEGNDASRRVMEKNGMKFEGIMRGAMLIKGDYKDIGVCAITRKDFFEKDPI
ncbi:MAG: GNAT family N-acetyltransferase [Clostridia bacterium]|nr:GNAT family N-acetyltransferase [Clostridia bacterium]